MNVYGIGAYYSSFSPSDVSPDFIDEEGVFVGYDPDDAPSFHTILRRMQIGDLVYIKAIHRQKNAILVKAVGMVSDDEIIGGGQDGQRHELGTGRRVSWLWRGDEPVTLADHDPANRDVTIYEELDPKVQREIVRLALTGLSEGDAERRWDADGIRDAAHKLYVQPARTHGETTVTIRAGDLADEIDYHGRMPHICSAIDAAKFLRPGLELVERSGPNSGRNARWLLRLT
jgi:hypothetical protein